MKSFLQYLAEKLYSDYGRKLSDAEIIFPNRRAGLYFARHLSQLIEKPLLMPAVKTIDQYVSENVAGRLYDDIELMAVLFKAAGETGFMADNDFGRFISWSRPVLKDFNDVDLALADAEELFSNLNSARWLSVWNPSGEEPTPAQKTWLEQFEVLLPIYKRFRELLTDAGGYYQGMAYRELAERYVKDPPEVEHPLIIAGLNALTPAELAIVKALKGCSTTQLVWDGDNYYINDRNQEAGKYLRKNQKVFGALNLPEEESHFITYPKQFEAIGTSSVTGQTIVAHALVKKLLDQGVAPESIALVLCDEQMLLPVLQNMPKEVTTFNITMGFPLSQSGLYQWVNQVISLNEEASRMRQKPDDPLKYDRKPLVRLLEFPLISQWIEQKGFQPQLFREVLYNKVHRYFTVDELKSVLHQSFSSEFYQSLIDALLGWETANDALRGVTYIVGQISEWLDSIKSSGFFHRLDREAVIFIRKVINQYLELKSAWDITDDTASLATIFRIKGRTSRIPFTGEPLSGVQIMGMLESRNLDFGHVIFVSANEGHLPAGPSYDSLIPNDIRSYYGLPVHHDQVAVTAFHFYRLLQRCSQAWFIYHSEGGMLGGGEKSRFLVQLRDELCRHYPENIFTERVWAPLPVTRPVNNLSIPKEASLLRKIRGIVQNGLSPTALNTFRKCSLRYYFQNLTGIQEPDDPDQPADAKSMGSIVHEVLNQIYQPFINREIDGNELAQMKKKIDSLVRAEALKVLEHHDIDTGSNFLMLQTCAGYVRNMIDFDLERIKEAPVRIKYLETKFENTLSVNINGSKVTAKIMGYADRVENWGGKEYILDYKTGMVKDKELNQELDMESPDDPSLDYALQLEAYKYIYRPQSEPDRQVNSGIISFRNLSGGILEKENNDDTGSMKFQEFVGHLIARMLNPDEPFRQTGDEKNCAYCPFAQMCGR
ncbi:MAG: PD-(D/E)XK nuclease family protein [Bacteroidales bacterium]